jgi:hypothetical protein
MSEGLSLVALPESKNGVAKPRGRKPRSPEQSKPRTVRPPQFWTAARFKAGMTVGMGCGIPLLSLSLSTISGTLARSGHGVLSGAAALLTASVLSVSLSHLAWAVREITGSPRWASWALAIAFDVALVLGESTRVYASDAGLEQLVTAVMVAVCGLSMLLNCWAFFKHPAK